MAINYNEEGMYLGYFETLGTLLSQYVGRRGNFAIVGNSLMFHNGNEWVEVSADATALKELAQSNASRLDVIENGLAGFLAFGFEIRWGYHDVINPDADEPDLYSKSALEPNAEKPVVYTTTRYLVTPTEFSKWSEPVVFSRFVEPAKDADGSQNIYYLSSYNDLASQLRFELIQLVVNPNYQNDNFVPEHWTANVPQPTAQEPYVYMATRKQVNGVWQEYTMPVIVYTHIVGKDGVINYEDTSKYIAQYLQTDEQWGAVLGRIDNIEGQAYVTTSTLEATAEEISANVSTIVDGKFQSAGWDVTSDGVTLYGDTVKIKPTKDSPSYIAMFDQDGYFNTNLIKTVTSYYYGNNGDLKTSINKGNDGMIRTYWPVDKDDAEAVKKDPILQLEIGWDANTQSVIRLYNSKGKMVKAMKMDGVMDEPVYTKPYEKFTVKSYCDITGATEISQTYPIPKDNLIPKPGTTVESFYEHDDTHLLYVTPSEDEKYLYSGELTPPGSYDYRPIYKYEYGKMVSRRHVYFASPEKPTIDDNNIFDTPEIAT